MNKSIKYKCFELDKDLIHTVNLLTNEQAGDVFRHILEYCVNQNAKPNNDVTDLVCTPIKLKMHEFWERNQMGDSHWNWKDGISPENAVIRNSKEIKQWRKEVFERDKYTCTACKKEGGTLHAHHVLGFATHHDLRFEVSNGQTLCKKCHNDIHRKK